MKNVRFLGTIASIKDLYLYAFNSAPLFFSLIGGYWLLIEFSSFLFPGTQEFFKQYGYLGIPTAAVLSLWLCRPLSLIAMHLQNRDVKIEIKIGDFFSTKHDYIIASTTSFDTSLENGTVSKDTLLGNLIIRYFSNNLTLLNQQIESSLEGERYVSLPLDWIGNKKKYNIGTVAKISMNNSNCYLVGINNKNKYGNVDAHDSGFEDVKVALAQTWEFIGTRGDLHPLSIALLGTGRGRVKEKRIEVAKEIIKSFIAANSSSRFTNKLTIVIHPNDVRYNIDVHELVEYLHYQCKYTQFSSTGNTSNFPASQAI